MSKEPDKTPKDKEQVAGEISDSELDKVAGGGGIIGVSPSIAVAAGGTEIVDATGKIVGVSSSKR